MSKMCGCGRNKLLTGRQAVYNGRDKNGRVVCSQCIIDAIVAPFIKKD